MAKKTKADFERFGRILDGLADYIHSASDEELLEDARREGRDPAQTEIRVKGWLHEAVKNHQRLHLQKQQQQYEREVAAMSARKIVLPTTAKRRRELLSWVFHQQPRLEAAFTFQNRSFSDLTDEDIERHLRKLVLLGLLKDSGLADDDE